MRVFHLPKFLEGVLTRESYVRWLQRKAQAHIKRDRQRGNINGTVSEYKRAIHQAVCDSEGFDQYTNDPLDWGLLSTYRNEESREGRRTYKAKFSLLPTVDHVGDGSGDANFKICGWAVNDAKGDLSLLDFVRLCQRVHKINSHLLEHEN